MTDSNKCYQFKKQTIDKDCETILSPAYDPVKDFHRDPTGYYVLIKVSRSESMIEVAICNKDHEIIKIFQGSSAQQIYYTLFKYEHSHKLRWFSRKDHMAYLGKELARAEVFLNSTLSEYTQE